MSFVIKHAIIPMTSKRNILSSQKDNWLNYWSYSWFIFLNKVKTLCIDLIYNLLFGRIISFDKILSILNMFFMILSTFMMSQQSLRSEKIFQNSHRLRHEFLNSILTLLLRPASSWLNRMQNLHRNPWRRGDSTPADFDSVPSNFIRVSILMYEQMALERQ